MSDKKETRIKELLLKHHAQAFVNALYEDSRRVYVCFIVDHPQVHISPKVPQHAVSEIDLMVLKDHQVQHQTVKSLTLNISTGAIGKYAATDVGFEVQCRFSGILTEVVIPYSAIAAIYDPEDSSKVVYQLMPDLAGLSSTQPQPQIAVEQPKDEVEHPRPGRSHLRVVK